MVQDPMHGTPDSRDKALAGALAAALTDSSPPERVSDEELAALALGDFERLSEARQSAVLRHIAGNPASASLVAELMHAAEASDAVHAPVRSVGTGRSVIGWIGGGLGLAAAACVALVVGLQVEPTPTVSKRITFNEARTVGALAVESGASNGDPLRALGAGDREASRLLPYEKNTPPPPISQTYMMDELRQPAGDDGSRDPVTQQPASAYTQSSSALGRLAQKAANAGQGLPPGIVQPTEVGVGSAIEFTDGSNPPPVERNEPLDPLEPEASSVASRSGGVGRAALIACAAIAGLSSAGMIILALRRPR